MGEQKWRIHFKAKTVRIKFYKDDAQIRIGNFGLNYLLLDMVEKNKNAGLTEEDMVRLEEQIPHLAAEATANAFKRAIASGHAVVIAEAGKYQLNPDGSRTHLKDLLVMKRKSQAKCFTIR